MKVKGFSSGLILIFMSSRVFGQVELSRMGANGPLTVLNCDDVNAGLCTELARKKNYEGKYTGHDEPSVLFYSDVPGAGNSSIYRLKLPNEPHLAPKQDGTGGTFNFQLRPAFWFGMAMCDTESAPNFTHACTPNSDANIFDNPDPRAPDYIGQHPGAAYMELQFYPPGWVGNPSCDPIKWCAALTIDSLGRSDVTGQDNNSDCLARAGEETINFAYITKKGIPVFPANPLGAVFGNFLPDRGQILLMNPGDTILVFLRDTPGGLNVALQDLTTQQSGSMTAGPAGGFGQIPFQPDPDPANPTVSCSVQPYAFHPMYSTSREQTRVPWAAHSYNIAFSDEIGHFEYCASADFNFTCTAAEANNPNVVEEDDFGCVSPPSPFLPLPYIQIGGCIASDLDFNGVSYQNVWPGSLSDPGQDSLRNPTPVRFTSPSFIGPHGLLDYQRVAFETNLPRVESSCVPTSGVGCVNPPPGANFYPFFSTASSDGRCYWQIGGPYIPGTTETFGGSSTAEFGDLISLDYPAPLISGIGESFSLFVDFRQVLDANPCPALTRSIPEPLRRHR